MEQPTLIPFPSIRSQLLVVSLVVLVLPWIGIKMIWEMESLLREQQVQSLMSTAETVRSGLGAINNVLDKHNQRLELSPANSEILLSNISAGLYVDGYSDDWPEDGIRLHYDAESHLLDGSVGTNLSVEAIIGYQSDGLMLLFNVADDVLYQHDDLVSQNSDMLLLGFKGADENYRRYIIGSKAPGWLTVMSIDESYKKENRIRAELQSKKDGYTIEISIPDDMAKDSLSFAFIDRDNDNPEHFSVIGNADPRKKGQYGFVFDRYSEIKDLLSSYQIKNRRIAVVDARSNILAMAGNIETSVFETGQGELSIVDRLYQLLLIADAPVDSSEPGSYRLDASFVVSALKGKDDYRFQRTAQGVGVLAVARPIILNNQIVGALVIEESTQTISGLRQEAQFNVAWMTLLAIGFVILVLLLYATFLISRIRRLNKQMQSAVDSDGRIHNDIPRARLDDEIGDLNRGVVNMVDRLQEYQRYMETMASKLSHELRTPLTVVQSSLENLQGESNQNKHDELLGRANEGLSRLRTILKSLTEASRLENALKSAETIEFNLVEVIESCVEGYRLAYPDIEFKFDAYTSSYKLVGSPDLMAQLLDKLVSNAIDFHTDKTPIRIIISESTAGSNLSVENTGPPLPEKLQGTLFDSMVSEREERDDMPHLGMGLFVVRLIAEFHHARVSALNLADKVKFTVRFSS